MKETTKKRSKYGVASCLIGVLNLGYMGVLLFNPFAGKSFLGNFDPFGQVLGLFFLPFLFLIVPAVGNGIGLIVGIVGWLQKDCKKLFVVIGLLMNLVIPTILIAEILSFFYQNRGLEN